MKTVEIFMQALLSVWDDLPAAVGDDWEQLLPEILQLLAAIQQSDSEEERLLLMHDLLNLFRPYPAAWQLLREARVEVGSVGETSHRGGKSPWPKLPTLPELFESLESMLPDLPELALPKGLREPKDMAMELGDPEGVEGETAAGEHYQALRIDAAVPQKVVIDEAFVLAVSVRQLTSAVLQEADLEVVHSGGAGVFFEDPEKHIRLRLRVSAPDCDVEQSQSPPFPLRYGVDSPVFYFHLTPRKVGAVSIIVQLFQEDEWMGGTRLTTEAAAATPAGTLAVHVVSEPVNADIDPELKRQVEAKEAQLQTASEFLSILERQLVSLAPGLERAQVEQAITQQKAVIKDLERDVDWLMEQAGAGSA